MVIPLQRSDAGPDLADDACALVPENRRKLALGIETGKSVSVGMADAGRHDLNEHLSGLRPFKADGFDGQRLSRFPGHCGSGFHDNLSLGLTKT
jgi:hypothetical protein